MSIGWLLYLEQHNILNTLTFVETSYLCIPIPDAIGNKSESLSIFPAFRNIFPYKLEGKFLYFSVSLHKN